MYKWRKIRLRVNCWDACLIQQFGNHLISSANANNIADASINVTEEIVQYSPVVLQSMNEC